MRADIHDGREHMLQSEAGYIDARPHHRNRRNLLHRTAGPYIGVKTRLPLGPSHVRFHRVRTLVRVRRVVLVRQAALRTRLDQQCVGKPYGKD
jgi:hypothetical protein